MGPDDKQCCDTCYFGRRNMNHSWNELICCRYPTYERDHPEDKRVSSDNWCGEWRDKLVMEL